MRIERVTLKRRIGIPVLAMGTEKKNRVCLARGRTVYLGPAIEDTANVSEFLDFKSAVNRLIAKNPKVIACDLHPEYASSRYAQSLAREGYVLKGIQHHHAHICSGMLENGLVNQKVIGVAFDGTGLGTDGNLWGAEFLVCDYRNFRRAASLMSVPLMGAEKAITEPWRISCFWLWRIFKDEFLELPLPLIKKIKKRQWEVIKTMYLAGFNCPLSSSMGRLFDAAASLILGRTHSGYEAQLARELQAFAHKTEFADKGYRFAIRRNNAMFILDPLPLFREMVSQIIAGRDKAEIALSFHSSIARLIHGMSLTIRKETGINKVVLSGGVFQNGLLLRLASDLLHKEGFAVLTSRKFSCGDYGIALGEIAIAGGVE